MQKSSLLAAASLVAAATVPSLALAQSTPWSVRLAGTEVHMADQSDAFSALGLNFPSGAVHVGNKLIPEFDINYAFTPNIVAQLVLTYPQTANVTLGGPTQGASLGTFKFLPPTLVAQYHFLPGQAFDPYVGAGINYTWITSVHLGVAGVPLDLKKSSFGAALNVGGDFKIDKAWFVNADVKYINPLQSDVLLPDGSKLTTAKLNPLLYSLGVGYRF
jgi:outer membrane protein